MRSTWRAAMNTHYSLVSAVSLVLALIFAFAPAPAVADENWVEVSSENFVVRTNADQGRAETLVRDLERFRVAVAYLTRLDLSSAPSVPLIVYAYAEQDQYAERLDMAGTLGFYAARREGPIAALSLEDGEDAWLPRGREVLFHEYMHHVLHQYSPIEYPRWYDEGLAEFFSTMEFENDRAIIGKPPMGRMTILARVRNWLSVRELVESKGQYLTRVGTGIMRDRRRGRTGIFHQYAQGWLLTHFLHNSEQFRPGIGRYLGLVNQSGMDGAEAFEQAFGVSYSGMDRALRQYWRDERLPVSAVDLSGRVPEFEVTTRRFHPHEIAAADYEARLLTGRLDRSGRRLATAAFRACLDEGVRPMDMRHYLARIAMIDEDWETAGEHIEAMLAEQPEHAPALTAKARLLRLSADDEADLDEQQVKAIQDYSRRAIVAKPTYVPALFEYAEFTIKQELPVDSGLISVVDSIRFLAPDLVDGKILEARLLARQQAFDEALAAVDSMIEWTKSPEQTRRFRQIRQEIEAQAAPNG